MDTLEIVGVIILIVVLVAFRVLCSFWIARAARKRGAGYGGWIVCGLWFGALIVGLIYLIFVHRKPILPERMGDAIL
jgi:4-amino-4-deoxy-L-arabinose transferase-like glycosyltransferase